jgi:hypothetical protein
VSARAKAPSETQGEHSFAERLSPLIAKAGVVAVPVLLIRHQADLDLTDGELVYLLQVLAHKWARAWPWIAVSDVVKATGHHERNVRSRKQSVEQKGYLLCRPQWKADGTRGGDEHDLSGLFAALERLAIEDQTKQALDEAQADLPEPRYYQGGLQAAPKTEKRATLRVRRRGKAAAVGTTRNPRHPAELPPGDIATTPPGDIATTRPAISPATLLALSPAQSETGKQKTLTPLTPQGARGGDEERDGALVLKADDSFQPTLPRTAAVALPASGWDDPAEHLLAAFCRGLDSDLASLTSRQRRSDLKLARELHAAGATPAEAEAYARESNADPRRIAPVTLRSFARERQAWLQRRGRSAASGPRLVDRTGQPGSWSTAKPAERVAGDRLGTTAGAMARAIVGGAS